MISASNILISVYLMYKCMIPT